MLSSIRTAGPVSGHNNNNVITFDRQATYKLLLHLQSSLAIDSKNITQHREIKRKKLLGYGGERERLLNDIILTSLSGNVFTDLRR